VITAGAVVNADINASAAIALTKLANVTAAYIIVGNASNVPTAVAVSGDITIDNAGAVAIAAGVIVNADVKSDAAIARSKLAEDALQSYGIPLYVVRAADLAHLAASSPSSSQVPASRVPQLISSSL
tara:strand:- start:100 stop:480 length:381 start_codon:yes stop_codon:yes gene_type:complete